MNQAGHKFGVGREKIHLTFVSEKSYVLFLRLHFVSNNSQDLFHLKYSFCPITVTSFVVKVLVIGEGEL
uniref:Uncharacterized protein n=1 Tax=Setaria viridis TaxID=4556 RepID=A0A4U6WAD4_SETVI|nr:hypothetical protein SEVIR_1G184600v2 [Setaria viridis]